MHLDVAGQLLITFNNLIKFTFLPTSAMRQGHTKQKWADLVKYACPCVWLLNLHRSEKKKTIILVKQENSAEKQQEKQPRKHDTLESR